MLIMAVHQAPSLTQERHEEVVRRLTGKSRIETLRSSLSRACFCTARARARTGSMS